MKCRIILEWNYDTCQWEWQIERMRGKDAHGRGEIWSEVPGDYFWGQNNTITDAVLSAEDALERAENNPQ